MTRSLWRDCWQDFNTMPPVYGQPEKLGLAEHCPMETDTLVIGGGLLGLSTALELAEAGHRVAAFEARRFAEGPSGRSGGQLWPGYEMALSEMIDRFGQTLATKAWKLTDDALAVLHRRAAARRDHCDFHAGVLLASKTNRQFHWIEEEVGQFQKSGLDFASLISGDAIKQSYVRTDLYLNGILYQGSDAGRQYGHLNPLKYTQTVARLAIAGGAILVEENPVTGVLPLADGRYAVTSKRGESIARNIVLATGVDLIRPKGINFKLLPRTHIAVQTVILATGSLTKPLAQAIVPGQACFCDAADAAMTYGAMIPDPDRSGQFRLTFGGADSLAQIETALEIRKIERELVALFPQLSASNIQIERIWGGNCDLSRDALPVLLNPCDGVYHASGFSGQGMVNTTLYGSAIADRILGRSRDRFDTLTKLNGDSFADNLIIAWVQAARSLFAAAFAAYREERAERFGRAR